MDSAAILDFECFEQQILEFIGEYQTVSGSEHRLREALRAECSRAEAAEAARDAAQRAAIEARADAAAAGAGATQASVALTKAYDDLQSTKMQLEISDHQRCLLEKRCNELSLQLSNVERELQQLRPLRVGHDALKRQYNELQERVRVTTEEVQNEVSRLECELRRVEKCASGGAELRERARLAAAAHARERRLADAELRHASLELLSANAQIVRLNIALAEARSRSRESGNESESFSKRAAGDDIERLSESQAALEAERAGAARLERALAAALADNAALAARAARDAREADAAQAPGANDVVKESSSPQSSKVESALDSFLAE